MKNGLRHLEGFMEIPLLKVLLNDISHFSLLSTCDSVKSELVQKYYFKIDEILKHLKNVLDEIVDIEIASDEQLVQALESLDTAVIEAAEVTENWHQLTSKIYFVLEIECLVEKIQMYGREICRLLEALVHSHPDVCSLECLKSCMQKIQRIEMDQVSTAVKETLSHFAAHTMPTTETLSSIASSLSLTSNQDLLLEAVALENVKGKVGYGENSGELEYISHMIALVEQMHEDFLKANRTLTINGIVLPADFCCPLSLELMSDPVIVSSGQTYERAFIRKWLDLGITVCPKTRQALSQTNLVTNYTVKALIANWCESNNIKLPDPVKTVSQNQPSSFTNTEHFSVDRHGLAYSAQVHQSSPESDRSLGCHSSQVFSPSNPMSAFSHNVMPSVDNQVLADGMNEEDKCGLHIVGQTSSSSRRYSTKDSSTTEQHTGHLWSNSVANGASNVDANETPRVSAELIHNNSEMSGEITSNAPGSPTSQRDPVFPVHLPGQPMRSRSQNIYSKPPDRLVPRIVSSSAVDSNSNLSSVETQVKKLVEDLQSTSHEVQRDAAAEVRLLARHSTDNRIVIANCGAICHLVRLLHSTDLKAQENAVTALLNLSINDNNKTAIANAEAISPLIHVLKTGNPEAKENAAATLFSLSVMEENKVKIGQSGAVGPLVDLLGNGTPRGKKDAATALFNLSIYHENKARIVQAGAVKYLVELMDPAAGMVDKAVAVLANLATLHEGRVAIDKEGGIPVLVEVVELGSSRGKENAAAALLQLCKNSNKFCSAVLREGAVPPLVALSQSGTPRGKEKAQALLNFFRNQRHGHSGRG